jgi:hypothetical protein
MTKPPKTLSERLAIMEYRSEIVENKIDELFQVVKPLSEEFRFNIKLANKRSKMWKSVSLVFGAVMSVIAFYNQLFK